MLRNLGREFTLMGRPPQPGDDGAYAADGEALDSYRFCEHTPDQMYTRQPCSCGRPLWPPRGRGRGESQLSPRRLAARLRALAAIDLVIQDAPYAQIARMLGYKTPSGAWRAVQRLRDEQAAWRCYEERTGHHPAWRHQPTDDEIERALANLNDELTHRLDRERLEAATDRVRRLLVRETRERQPGPGTGPATISAATADATS